ncbi:hypothetical protein G7Z17_g1643 [Cylindrodendrum hubeiense]|uniref:Uncharacterized protein n=1 Tax=Cylindrodendrum hubeiense TaxID=595255 RepID=A0A9P5LJY0_9HYPO|nr:hypothetical protein G7Z17_g1643 [Cylindrodendrum hubeiense]
METDSKTYDLLPPYEPDDGPSSNALEPTVLVLAGQSIHAETATSAPLYQMSRSVISPTPKQDGTSVTFERIEHSVPEKVEGTASAKPRTQLLFYLAHPVNAEYRKDTPAYFITAASPQMVGNIVFETSKSVIQKTEFKALLSANRTASDKPLFDEKAEPLFNIKPKWKGGGHKWTGPDGTQVALEEGKGAEHKLAITAPMEREMRDALVAMWVLRLWHDTAETRQAKREVLESMTPISAYSDMKLAKRAGALSGIAGGAC